MNHASPIQIHDNDADNVIEVQFYLPPGQQLSLSKLVDQQRTLKAGGFVFHPDRDLWIAPRSPEHMAVALNAI